MPPGPEVERMKDPRSGARVLDRLLRDAGLRRRTFLGATGVAVIVVVLATVLLTVIPLSSFKTTSDRLVWVGDVLVGATLLLAAIAAIVALVAYAVSTGLPDLQLSVQFGRSSPNNPTFEADNAGNGVLEALTVVFLVSQDLGAPEPFIADEEKMPALNSGKVFLRNNSGYSAKNPAVIVRLHGMFFLAHHPDSFEREWASMETADVLEWTSGGTADPRGSNAISKGMTIVQWDGGPTYSVHGNSTRRLPDLQFSNLWHISGWGEPVLTFEILAERYRKVVSLPVDFMVDGKSRYPREKTLPEWL